jgi:hypothetical protein
VHAGEEGVAVTVGVRVSAGIAVEDVLAGSAFGVAAGVAVTPGAAESPAQEASKSTNTERIHKRRATMAIRISPACTAPRNDRR